MDFIFETMHTSTIDCQYMNGEADFWVAYVAEVKPDGAQYFGRNLDAFWDAVSRGGPGSPGDCNLHLVNTDGLSTWNKGAFVAGLRRIAVDSKSIEIRIE